MGEGVNLSNNSGFDSYTVKDEMANLQTSGNCARIIRQVIAEIEAQNVGQAE
jgi:hypothetical protein